VQAPVLPPGLALWTGGSVGDFSNQGEANPSPAGQAAGGDDRMRPRRHHRRRRRGGSRATRLVG